MESKITSVRNNPLLDRNKVKVEIQHEGESTPSEEDVKNRVAAENDLDTEKIEVDSIYTGYGSKKSEATLKVFQDFEYDEELEEEPEKEQKATEASASESTDSEYDEIVSGTITDAKDELNEMDDPDFNAALKAEKQNKNRATLVEWLENQLD